MVVVGEWIEETFEISLFCDHHIQAPAIVEEPLILPQPELVKENEVEAPLNCKRVN